MKTQDSFEFRELNATELDLVSGGAIVTLAAATIATAQTITSTTTGTAATVGLGISIDGAGSLAAAISPLVVAAA